VPGPAISAIAAGWALAAAVLEGIAVLPAETRAPGPPSGQFIEAGATLPQPFPDQPVQGFSSLWREANGQFLALTDNGYGSRANSPDFLLRIYSLSVNFRTASGGSGRVTVNGFVSLSDPGEHIGFPITAERATYSGAQGGLPVDPGIREHRWLTGGDLDTESLAREPDGSYWIGDEFGPYVLHFDAGGALLEPPYSLAGLASPDRPGSPPGAATIRRSRGFEGMAMAPDGARLYPMLESGPGDDPRVTFVYTFDVSQRRFLNRDANDPSYRYRLEAGAEAIGEFSMTGDGTGLVVERDSGQGATATLKKIFAVDLGRLGDDGCLAKREVADLLAIADPDDLDGDGRTTFRFDHWTIESVVALDAHTLLVVNDNNYPFGHARRPDQPDGTEFIRLHVEPALW